MSSETPGPTVEVKEEASAPPEDSVIEAETSPAVASSTPAPMGISKEMTETLNGIVRRLADARDKEEYGSLVYS